MKDEKYIVFKREEFEKSLEHMPSIHAMLKAEQLQDAVVIRLQDAFAPPALDAYANSILIALELDTEPYSATHSHLMRVADYFRARAEEAWGLHRKLPD